MYSFILQTSLFDESHFMYYHNSQKFRQYEDVLTNCAVFWALFLLHAPVTLWFSNILK